MTYLFVLPQRWPTSALDLVSVTATPTLLGSTQLISTQLSTLQKVASPAKQPWHVHGFARGVDSLIVANLSDDFHGFAITLKSYSCIKYACYGV